MELYTAIILLCTFNGTEVDTCSTITYPEPFQNRLECQKNMDKHEMASGAMWAEANIYVISSSCIDWKWYTNKRFLMSQYYK
jgi:hypothetical protein